MSAYPSSIKSFTAKTDFIDDVLAAHVNDIQNEIMAIETELGTLPKGGSADVKARIVAAEARLTALETRASDLELGWTPADETWTYVTATSFTISGDKTAKYSKGDKIRVVQTTTKYAYVINVVYGAPNTTITIIGDALEATTISSPYYSRGASPVGFPYWFAFTPSWTNLTVGNGTNVGFFRIQNGSFEFQVSMTLGSTSSVGASAVFFTTPIANAGITPALIGISELRDTGTTNFPGQVQISGANIYPLCMPAGGTYVTYSAVTTTTPHTWAATDILIMTGSYRIF